MTDTGQIYMADIRQIRNVRLTDENLLKSFNFSRSFTRNCIFSGNNPIGIHNGIDGLLNDEVKPIEWSDVTGWIAEVGNVGFFANL